MEKEEFKAEVKSFAGRVFDFISKNPKTTAVIVGVAFLLILVLA